MHRTFCLLGLVLSGAAILGCGPKPPPPPPPKPPEVVVSEPVVKEVTDYQEFTGHTAAVADVQVRARISGYLEQVFFQEGTEVQEGDPLFEIDPRTYKADLDQKQASVAQAEAHLKRMESDYQRAVELLPAKAISQTDFDQIVGDRDEAAAALKLAKAARDLSRLNLGFTQVMAPLSGRISRQQIDPGNMVTADQTVLTSIVSLDPVYAYFNVDERTMLQIRRLVRAGKMKSSREAAMPVFLALADEEGYPHQGTVNFVDNRVDASTGNLNVRGVFDNPQRMLSPGLYARIRLPIGAAHTSLAISEQALGSDQGQKFIYVINEKNEAVYRHVKTGKLEDGLRVIDEGLSPGERVVVAGLQRIRPGIKVTIKSLEAPATAGSPAPAAKPAGPSGSQPPAASKSEAKPGAPPT